MQKKRLRRLACQVIQKFAQQCCRMSQHNIKRPLNMMNNSTHLQKINEKKILWKLETKMAVSTVLHGCDIRTSLKQRERRTEPEEMKILEYGAKICL